MARFLALRTTVFIFGLLMCGARAAQPMFTVELRQVSDEKAVFATVESRKVVPARARIGGTLTDLRIVQGDHVTQGQVIAVVTDPKLQLQIQALNAEIAGLNSAFAQAQLDLARAMTLAKTGAVSNEARDKAETAARVASSALKARIAQRAITSQEMAEGQILAPTAGRVLDVPVTNGSVLLAGDAVATIAEQDYVLRLSVPERHARFLKRGDPVRLDGRELGETGPVFGKITLIYPEISDGQVRVDATAPGIGDYFVGERIRVWVAAGTRKTFVIPSRYLTNRFGLDYVEQRLADGATIAIPVQPGLDHPTPAMPDGVEILSGLAPGDVLVQP